jgi:proteasome lid subunit RPN8/RPN11
VPRQLLDRLIAEARAGGHHEICGLLLGGSQLIEAAWPVANVESDTRSGFHLDPRMHLRASRAARQAGMRIVGHYHSHPRGSAFPSRRDAAGATEAGVFWLILGACEQRLWMSEPGGPVHRSFRPVEMDLSGSEGPLAS